MSYQNMSGSAVGEFYLGLFLATATIPGIAANTICVIAIIHKGFLSRDEYTAVYKLMLHLLVSDTFQLLVLLVYCSGSFATQGFLLPDRWVWIPTFALLLNWYGMCFLLSTIAINRYFAVCRNQLPLIFGNHRFTDWVILLIWICALFLACAQFVLPCCELRIYYSIYSYAYFPLNHTGQFNYTDSFILWPANVITLAVIVFCYSNVIWQLHVSYRQNLRRLNRRTLERRRRRDIRITLQFTLISAIFITTFLSFRVMPLLIPETHLRAYILIPLFVCFNSSINSFLYLYFNKDLRIKALEMFGLNLTTSRQQTSEILSGSNRLTSEILSGTLATNSTCECHHSSRLHNQAKKIFDSDMLLETVL